VPALFQPRFAQDGASVALRTVQEGSQRTGDATTLLGRVDLIDRPRAVFRLQDAVSWVAKPTTTASSPAQQAISITIPGAPAAIFREKSARVAAFLFTADPKRKFPAP
jgi:hypothetical protein